MTRPPISDKGLARRLLLIALLLNATLAMWAVYALTETRQGYEEKARITTQNLARMLDQSVAASATRIDLTLLTVVDELERQLREYGHLDAPRSSAFLRTHEQRMPEVLSLLVSDATGRVVLGQGASGGTRASWEDRDFFRLLREHDDLGLHVVNPVFGRVTQTWIIPFLRRYNHPDGRFAGLVSASVPVRYLDQLLSSTDVGPKGLVLLCDAKLGMIARHPASNAPSGAPGAKDLCRELEGGIQSGQHEFSFHGTGATDGVERINAYRRMHSVPFHLVVGQGSADYLSMWTLGAQRTFGALAVILLVTSVFAWFLWHSLVKKRQGEQLLRSSEEQMATSQAIGGTGSWSYDIATTTIRASTQSLKIFGFPSAHRDYPLDAFLACIPQRQRVENILADAISTGRAYDDEYLMHPADGSSAKIIHAIGKVEHDTQGNPLRVQGFIQDVTGQRQTEQALRQQTEALKRSNAELEQFAYVASHDLRQPLRMVNSYVQLLERTLAARLDDDTREMMHFAADGAKRMDQMLVSLLEYSRVGRKGEPLAPLNSRNAVDEALHFLAPAIQETQASVRVAGDWPNVMVSRDEFTRLWQNLIGNALKYRAVDRTPHIDVTVTPEEQGWRFCVADNGIGIDPAQFERLFKVFQRLHPRDQYEGYGIGLAIARKIVERHGGHIWVESDGADLGCRFCFNLPEKSLS